MTRSDAAGKSPLAAHAENDVRVMLVEDEPLYRDLLSMVLSQQRGIRIVGAFADGESALEATPRLSPRVAMLDIELGKGMHGVEVGLLLRQRCPEIGIVLLSNHADPRFVAAVPDEQLAGWSYLLKKSVSDVRVLARAIYGVAAGQVVIDPGLVALLRPNAGSALARLTPRQYDILELVVQGFTNAATAQRLGIAEKSVENQMTLIYQHLDVDRENAELHPRVSAVIAFLREGSGRGHNGARP